MDSACSARAYGFRGRRMASRVRVGDLVAVRCAAGDGGEENGDGFYMWKCVELGKKAVGYTSPNSMVGCVIVKDGKVVGEGFHPKAWQPHAKECQSQLVVRSVTLIVKREMHFILVSTTSFVLDCDFGDETRIKPRHRLKIRPMVQVKLENAPALPLNSSVFNAVNMRHPQIQQLRQQQIVATMSNLQSQPSNQFRQMPAPQVPQVQTQTVVRAPPMKVEGFQELMGGDPLTKCDFDENKLISLPSRK